MVTLCGKKLGMTQYFDDKGALVPATVIETENMQVLRVLHNAKPTVLVSAFDQKEERLKKTHKGLFPQSLKPQKMVFEISQDSSKPYEVGQEITLSSIEGVEYVDIRGLSKGKGVQGVMKRYNTHGGPGRVGSKFRRGIGSTGQSATPSRVHKGTKMPGRMGNQRVTVQNLKVLKIDLEKNLLLIKGTIPGAAQGVVFVSPAIKKRAYQ